MVEFVYVECVDGVWCVVVDVEVFVEDVEGEYGIDDVGVDGCECI